VIHRFIKQYNVTSLFFWLSLSLSPYPPLIPACDAHQLPSEWRTIGPFEDINLTLCSGMKSGQPNKKGHWVLWRKKQERDKMPHVEYSRNQSTAPRSYLKERERDMLLRIRNGQSLEWVTHLPLMSSPVLSLPSGAKFAQRTPEQQHVLTSLPDSWV